MPVRHGFDASRRALDFRPEIEFVEPDQIEVQPPLKKPSRTLEEAKKALQGIIDSYREIEVMADLAQKRVDTRAQNFEIGLDPKTDVHVIAALMRHFPDKKDPTKITFDDYKHCIEAMSKHARDSLSTADASKAILDSNRVDFGGLGLPPGLNRPELDKDSQIVEPIDLDAFKIQQLKELFEALTSPIQDLAKKVAEEVVGL